MARLARVEFEGAIYHATVRGNQKQRIFRDDRDRERFIEKLAEYAQSFQVRVYAFCLMSNHVHLNPVFTRAERARTLPERVADLRAYRWSSYRCYAGKGGWDFVCVNPLLEMMEGHTTARKRVAMRRFMEAAIAKTDEEFMEAMKESPLWLGGAAFRERIQELYEGVGKKAPKPEDLAFRKRGRGTPAKRVVEVVCQVMGVEETAVRQRSRGNWLRPILADALARHAGMTQREIATVMGLQTGKAVSVQLARLQISGSQERNVARWVTEINEILNAKPND